MFPGMEMMFDPMMFAQMAQGIQANPMMFADAMAQTGMMPPPIGGPGMFQPNMAPAMPPAPVAPGNPMPGGNPAIMGGIAPQLSDTPFSGTPELGASLGGGGYQPTMGAVPGATPANDPMAALRAAGRGAPSGSADTRPIMSGGISGAGKAPDQKATKGSSSEMALLMQLLNGGGGAPVPGLGQLLGMR